MNPFTGDKVNQPRPAAKPQRKRVPGRPRLPRKPKAAIFKTVTIQMPAYDKGFPLRGFFTISALLAFGIFAGAFWPDFSKKKAKDDIFVMEEPPPPPPEPPKPPEPPPPKPPKIKPPPTMKPPPKVFGLQSKELATKSDMAVATGNTTNAKADSIVQKPVEALPIEISQPPLVTGPQPTYPPKALEREQSGTVILQVTIDAQGRVVRVDIKKSAGTDFDKSAEKSVWASKFTAPTRNGQAVPATFPRTIVFDFRSVGGGGGDE